MHVGFICFASRCASCVDEAELSPNLLKRVGCSTYWQWSVSWSRDIFSIPSRISWRCAMLRAQLMSSVRQSPNTAGVQTNNTAIERDQTFRNCSAIKQEAVRDTVCVGNISQVKLHQIKTRSCWVDNPPILQECRPTSLQQTNCKMLFKDWKSVIQRLEICCTEWTAP